MLASFDFTLVHGLVVVLAAVIATFLSSLFVAFATLLVFLLPILPILLATTFTVFVATFAAFATIATFVATFLVVLLASFVEALTALPIVLSGLLTYLHDCEGLLYFSAVFGLRFDGRLLSLQDLLNCGQGGGGFVARLAWLIELEVVIIGIVHRCGRLGRLGSLQRELVFELLDILASVALAHVVCQRLLTDAEHEGEAELEAVGLQEVALAADDEAARRDEHTRWRRLGHLIGVDPVDLRSDLVLPARTVAHLESGCLVQTQIWDWVAGGVLDDTDGGAMQL